jgi:diguanylate cyclase (GGDEF)-like protein
VNAAAPDPRPTAPEVAALQAVLAASHFERVTVEGPALFRAARDAGDWAVASDAALAVGRAFSNLTRLDEALRWTQESAQAAQQLGDAARECMAWGQLAAEHARHDHFAPALSAIGEMEQRLADVRSEPALQALLGSIATTFYGLGLTAPALQAYARALAIAERQGEPGQVVTLRTNWLVVARSHQLMLLEEPEAAASLLAQREQELARLEPAVAALDAPRGHWRLVHVSAGLHADAGRHAEAAAVLERLLEAAPPLPPVLLSSLWLDLAKAHHALGQADRARSAAQQAAEMTERAGPLPRSYDLHRRSEIAEMLGRPEEALGLHKRYHQRSRAVLTAAIESRLEGSLARLTALDTEAENQRLKLQNQDLAEGVARLGTLASTDPLTELLNRRGFDDRVARLNGLDGGAVVALIDIDRFKAVNDQHGHAMGDQVLRVVATRLSAALRPQDLLARQGGEEFVLLLLDLDPEAACRVLERMREAVASHGWQQLVTGLGVTISLGATRWMPGEPLAAALVRADRWLYQAKAGGRDRVVTDLVSATNPDTPA